MMKTRFLRISEYFFLIISTFGKATLSILVEEVAVAICANYVEQ